MSNPDLDKIIASVDAAIRQAYALGRRDALDHVARWAQTEETTSTQLALVAPASPSPPATEKLPPASAPALDADARTDAAPPRATEAAPRGFGALLRDFVYPR